MKGKPYKSHPKWYGCNMPSDRALIYGVVDAREPGVYVAVGMCKDSSPFMRAAKRYENSHSEKAGGYYSAQGEWVRKVYAEGSWPMMVPLEWVEDERKHEAEEHWKKHLLAEGHPLVNGRHLRPPEPLYGPVPPPEGKFPDISGQTFLPGTT